MVLGQLVPPLTPILSLLSVWKRSTLYAIPLQEAESPWALPSPVPVLGVVSGSYIYDFSHNYLYPTSPRFIKILDSVLHHLVPAWDHTLGTFSEIKVSLTHSVLALAVGTPFCSCSRSSESS